MFGYVQRRVLVGKGNDERFTPFPEALKYPKTREPQVVKFQLIAFGFAAGIGQLGLHHDLSGTFLTCAQIHV